MSIATLTLNADGTTADASSAALELLGVSLDELRALPPGAFSPEPADPAGSARFREDWERDGSPDIGGEATIQRLDGTRLRVKFAISQLEEGRFFAILVPVDGLPEAAPKVYTAGEVLREWRAAERRLAEIPPESPEWQQTQSEIEVFRARYQALFKRS